jgi:hypothetical protein
VAIVSGVFTMFSDLLGLTIYVPGLGEAANTGYQAVGSGVILFALTLLVIGMVGLYAPQPRPGGLRVIEYGDGQARYVLAGSEETRPAQPVGESARLAARRGPRRAPRRRGGEAPPGGSSADPQGIGSTAPGSPKVAHDEGSP